ncbi:MAG: class I SAM-dependent methyltransferase [Candidatus Dormibacteraeota bacterium]|nr:class I SAM-dependent methyltransferase [Candidatus Dormibacteraeota bacterium]
MQVRERRQAMGMEGVMARWYAQNRRTGYQMAEYRRLAGVLTETLPKGADVLEVASGPGYLAVEVARLGRFQVTGLDLSRSFVQLASDYARQESVDVDFRFGDAAGMPFEAESFDLIVCQAAFKNFGDPVRALDEMHRILRPGRSAVIQDMNRDTPAAEIEREVRRMELSRLNAVMTRLALAWLRRRAYSRAEFERLAAESAFRTCEIRTGGIGLEVWLTKPA